MNLIWRLSDILSEKFEKKRLEYLLSKTLDRSTQVLGSVERQFLILQHENFCSVYILDWHSPLNFQLLQIHKISYGRSTCFQLDVLKKKTSYETGIILVEFKWNLTIY